MTAMFQLYPFIMAEWEITDDARIASDIEVPHQPRKYHFPEPSFGIKGKRQFFKAAWFDTWPWLHYQEESDSVICFHCSQANNQNLSVKGFYGRCKDMFITKGFINCKDARPSLPNHPRNHCFALTNSRLGIKIEILPSPIWYLIGFWYPL